MFNPYSIILGLFLVAGLLATLWSLRIVLTARKTMQWPAVEGLIEESKVSSASSDSFERNDLLPHITFSYKVEQQSFQQLMKFPGDITPSEEFSKSYVKKYPVGLRVQVHYNPENPEISTLEPGLGKGDWLVLAIGLGTLVFGIAMFLLPG